MTNRLLLLLSLSLMACGSDEPRGEPVTEAEFLAHCNARCEHQIACGDTTGPQNECVDRCLADFPDVAPWLRGDALLAVGECTFALACGADDGSCVTACEPTDAHERFEAQCREVMVACDLAEEAECEVTPAAGTEGFLCSVTAAVMDELTACIPDGAACSDAAACLEAVIDRVGFGIIVN
jgi:hypothetical protein